MSKLKNALTAVCWYSCFHGNLCASFHAGCVSRFQECWYTSERLRQIKPPPPPLLLLRDCMLFPLTPLRMSPCNRVSCMLCHIESLVEFCRWSHSVLGSLACSDYLGGYTMLDRVPVCLIGLHNQHRKQTKLCQQRMDSPSPQSTQKEDYSAVHCRPFVF